MYCSNGMSNSRHDTPFANSGLVVTLEPHEFGSSHPLAGVHVQRQYESLAFQMTGGNYYAPVQRATDFLADRTPSPTEQLPSSYERGTRARNLSAVLPPSILKAMKAGLPILDRQWRGAVSAGCCACRTGNARQLAGSHRSRSGDVGNPISAGRLSHRRRRGYAGGIVTAAVDGLRAARKIIAKHRCPDV